MDTIDFPKYIELTPAPCSSVVKHNEFVDNYPNNILKAGEKVSFNIACHDEYDNRLTIGGDVFDVKV